MQSIKNEVIWVTGASSGIGQALAIHLSQLGNQVVISGRNAALLDQMAQDYSGMIPLAFDVVDPIQIARAREALHAQFSYIDRVILNAGTCEYLDIQAPDWTLFSRTFNVNLNGPVNCLEMALPLLKAAKAPHIVGVASLASIAPFPRAEAYGASKAAFDYLLESLRLDVKGLGIDVSVILPGFVDTPLTQKNDFEMPFQITATEAAMRMAEAIADRKQRFIFPKRLYWSIRLLHAVPGLWQRLMTPKTTVSTDDGATR